VGGEGIGVEATVEAKRKKGKKNETVARVSRARSEVIETVVI